LRLINALPLRNTMGPKLAMWLEEHLMIHLETIFRCARPIEVMPKWAGAAGFRMLDGSDLSVSRIHKWCPAAPKDAGREKKLEALAHRELWRNAWASSVLFEEEDKDKFWWEYPEILSECAELGTTRRVVQMLATKPE